MGIANEVLTSTSSPGDFVDGRLLPRGLSRLAGVEQDLLRFVFEDGFGIVTDTFAAGGWRSVSDGMARPATTQNMLHLDAEPRRPIDVSAVPAPGDDFVRVDTDRLGERGVVALVSRLTGKDSLALETAEGWSSDALIRWEAGAEGVTQWITLWADEKAAADFLYAWRRGLTRRHPDGIWTERQGGDQVLGTGRRDVWIDVEGRKVVTWVAEPARLEPWLPPPTASR